MSFIAIKTLARQTFSKKSFALNQSNIEFRLIHTCYIQKRKANQGRHHNQLQQVFYSEVKSKQSVLSTSSKLIRSTHIQQFGTSSSNQSSVTAKKKMVNSFMICCFVGVWCLLILSNQK